MAIDESSVKIKPKPKKKSSFDAASFAVKLLDGRLLNDFDVIRITAWEALEVCDGALTHIRKEGNLVEVAAPVNVLGDLHGHFSDLVRALLARSSAEIDEQADNPLLTRQFARQRYVFLGDYVNRGNRGVDILCLLFAFKILYPTRYFLLRGSHEIKSINETEFMVECSKRFGQNGPKVYHKFNEVFSWMPLMGLVAKTIICVHGGISPHLKSFNDVKMIKRPLVEPRDSPLATDLIWSDTLDYDFLHVRPAGKQNIADYRFNTFRNAGCLFSEAAVEKTLKRLNAYLIIRSHMMVPYGYRFFAGKSLITIFTASNYQRQLNEGAMLKINKNGRISIISLLAKPTIDREEEVEEAAEIIQTG